MLAARLRRGEEEATVRQIIHKVFKREVKSERLFQLSPNTSPSTLPLLKLLLSPEIASAFPQIAWTSDLLQLGVLVGRAWQHNEPVLLVGETGGGKTTVVHLLSSLLAKGGLHSINLHTNSEASDFLGGLRPNRKADQDGALFLWVDGPLVLAMRRGAVFLADKINLAEDSVLDRMKQLVDTGQVNYVLLFV